MVDALIEKDPVLAEMVRRLVANFNPDFIYLFGSRARGEATDDSDYDLMVVVPQASISFEDGNLRAYRLMYGLGASKDIVVLSRNDFERKQVVVCSLPATVTREGVLLYAA